MVWLRKYWWLITYILALLGAGGAYAVGLDRRLTVVETKAHTIEDDIHEIRDDVKTLLRRGH